MTSQARNGQKKMAAPIVADEIQRVLLEGNDADAQHCCGLLARRVSDGEPLLLQVVEALGPSLTSTDASVRSKGLKFLSELLDRLASNVLEEKEVRFLAEFYGDRLKDSSPAMVPPILLGAKALTGMDRLPGELLPKFLRDLLMEIPCQSQPQKDRRMIFQVVHNCCYKHLDVMLPMGSTFVTNVIQTMDGERDPRNLNLIFTFVPFLVAHFPVETLAEELFEVIACYFPVYFNQPQNNPNGITRQDLVEGLHRALASTPLFAQYLLPLALEKLDSEIVDAKTDALDVMKRCCAVYSPEHFKPHLSAMWRSFRREVLLGQNEQVARSINDTLKAVVKVIAMDPQEEGEVSTMEEFLGSVLKECRHHLAAPELRLMHPVANVLQAAAKACDTAYSFIMMQVVPVLLEQFTKQEGCKEKLTVLSLLTSFLKIQQDHSFSPLPTDTFMQKVPSIYLSSAASPDNQLRLEATLGLWVIMSQMKGPDERKNFWLHLVQRAVEEPIPDIRESAVRGLEIMGRKYPEEIVSESIPLFLDVISKGQILTHRGENCLSALSRVSSIFQVASAVVPCLIERIPEAPGPILNSLGNLAEQVSSVESARDTLLFMYCDCQLITVLLSTSVKWVLEGTEDAECLVKMAAKVIRTLVKALPTEKQAEVAELFSGIFVEDKTCPLIAVDEAQWKCLNPLKNPEKEESKGELLTILEAAVAFLRPDTNLLGRDVLCKELLAVALQSPKPIASNSAGRLWATLVNKSQDEGSVQNHLSSVESQLCQSSDGRSARLLTWLTKALVMRGHPDLDQWIATMVRMITPALAPVVSSGFETVVSDTEESLNSNCYCNIRLLYRQRFFLLSMQHLIPAFRACSDPTLHPHFLHALCSQLQHLPPAVVTSESPQLLPILIQSLDCDEGKRDLHLAGLKALGDLMEDAKSAAVVEDQLNALLPRLMALSVHPSGMKVRLAALRCVRLCAKLTVHTIYPHRTMVIEGLLKCVNDHKRLVRKAAVDARCGWFLLGPAEEGK